MERENGVGWSKNPQGDLGVGVLSPSALLVRQSEEREVSRSLAKASRIYLGWSSNHNAQKLIEALDEFDRVFDG